MSAALVTGSCGLVGGENVRFLCAKGFEVAGIDNDMRRRFFGDQGSVAAHCRRLRRACRSYRHISADIRDRPLLERVFKKYASGMSLIVHCAAQTSHDWSARDPLCDFAVNAAATVSLLELCRRYCPGAVFIYVSTNKVYGDTVNSLPLTEGQTRFEIAAEHRYARGIDESMSVDASMHSPFGVSKLAADLAVQEYARYFGLRTGVFRCGCVSGPDQAGVELQGFLSYLVRCALNGSTYQVFGFQGKQVRDILHVQDLVNAFWEFYRAARPGEVYNLGGGGKANVSVREAIALCESIGNVPLRHDYRPAARSGDHKWWISDMAKFRRDYPQWQQRYGIEETMRELFETVREGR